MRTLALVLALLPLQEEAATLSCAAAPAKGKLLALQGTAPLPDGTDIRVNLFPVREQVEAGKLVASPAEGGIRGQSQVTGKKFTVEVAFPEGPGFYYGTVQAIVTKKRWEKIALAAWDAAFIKQLGAAWKDLDQSLADGLKYIDRVSAASGTKKSWDAAKKEIEETFQAWLAKLEASDARRAYSAASGRLIQWVQDLDVATRKFAYRADKFAGVIDQYGAHKDPDQKDFALASYKKALDKVGDLAAREFGLWIVKERRRAGSVTPAASEAVKAHAQRLAAFAKRLENPAENLDTLEKDLRTLK